MLEDVARAAVVGVRVQHRPAAIAYNFCMGSKLSKTNPFLRDPATRERTVLKSVASSSAIEGIRAPFRKSANGGAKVAASSVAKNKR